MLPTIRITAPEGSQEWCETVLRLRNALAPFYRRTDKAGIASGQNVATPEDIALEWAAQQDFGGVYVACTFEAELPEEDLTLPNGIRLDVKNSRHPDRLYIAQSVFEKHRALGGIDYYLFGHAKFVSGWPQWKWKGLVPEREVERYAEWYPQGNPPCWRVTDWISTDNLRWENDA